MQSPSEARSGQGPETVTRFNSTVVARVRIRVAWPAARAEGRGRRRVAGPSSRVKGAVPRPGSDYSELRRPSESMTSRPFVRVDDRVALFRLPPPRIQRIRLTRGWRRRRVPGGAVCGAVRGAGGGAARDGRDERRGTLRGADRAPNRREFVGRGAGAGAARGGELCERDRGRGREREREVLCLSHRPGLRCFMSLASSSSYPIHHPAQATFPPPPPIPLLPTSFSTPRDTEAAGV